MSDFKDRPATSGSSKSSKSSASGASGLSAPNAGAPSPNRSSASVSDPFASPFSSRAPSIHAVPASPSSASFPVADIAVNSSSSSSTSGVNVYSTAAASRRSILSQTAFGVSAYHSAVSNATLRHSISQQISPTASAFPLPFAATATGGRLSGAAAPGTTHAPPKSKIARMKSHMVAPGTVVEKPWKTKPPARAIFSYWIVYFLVLCGMAGGAVKCWLTWRNVALDHAPLCLVMEENFDSEEAVFGENGTFQREVNMDGFGNGEFEMTTESRNNSFVQDGFLYIVPTLTSDNIGSAAVFDGAVYNITGCTFNDTRPDNGYIIDWKTGERVFDSDSYYRSCSAVSNATAGTVINPVQSARLTTRKSASINTGKVEIRAKMPNGDWMWPALWMLPRDQVYGAWPLSGEIDIVESKGNGIRYTAHGSNFVQGALNWGPAANLNGVSKSYSWWTDKRKSFASDFHTYTLEWTDKFLRISVDSRLHTLLDIRFDRPFFQRGDFPEVIFNGSSLVPLQNPWINGTNATPFDQEFYLIMNVAVGSTTGWFPEAQGNKPWLDRAQNPPHDFAKAMAQWYPTWPSNVFDRAMVIDYVKMYKHC